MNVGKTILILPSLMVVVMIITANISHDGVNQAPPPDQ